MVLCGYTTDGMALLTALASLRHLNLEDPVMPPDCLPELTWLERLEYRGDVWLLGEALPSLQRLTCLALFDGFEDSCQNTLPALAGLSRLQRLCIDGEFDSGADLSLPQGPWLASIRRLGLPWAGLEPAAGVLRRAPCLEYLCVFIHHDFPGYCCTAPGAHPLWELAATHPPLRLLGFCVTWNHSRFTGVPSVAGAAATLKVRRPQLRLGIFQSDADANTVLLEAGTTPQ